MKNKFSGNVFQLTVCWGCKMISVFILPSNTIFRKTKRELSEREIAPARRERERERERKKRPNLETDSDEPRKPKTELVRRADCTTVEIVAPQHRSTQNQSFLSHPKTDRPRPRFVVPDRDLAFAPITIAAPRRAISPSPPPHDLASCRTQSPLSLPSSLNLTRLWFFFFSGFYLCFWIVGWNYVFVWQMRKCEKMWATSRKCVFYGIFNNTTKH